MTDAALPLPLTEEVIRRGMAAGQHDGGQVHVVADGRHHSVAIGADRTGTPITSSTLMPLFCAARPFLALAVARLTLTHGLDLDAPVESYIPGFGRNGKEGVTVRHVLAHTSGVRHDPALDLRGRPWALIVDALKDAQLEPGWRPGEQAAYQDLSYWYVIGEIIMRVSGAPLGEYLRGRILEPLGLDDTWVGMTAREFEQNRARLGRVTQITPDGQVPAELETPHFCRGHLPFSPRGTARDLARFYDVLLRPEQFRELLPPELVRTFCTPSRTGMFDHGWGAGGTVDWAFIGVVESRRHSRSLQVFGRWSSDGAFGHLGHRATVGFADPEAGVAAAFCLTGIPDSLHSHLRVQAMCTAIYRDTRTAP